MKIVLIRPPEINRVWVGIPEFFNTGIFLFPPLGIMQLKAYIEKYTQNEVIIYDSLIHKADYEKIARFIKHVAPQVVGISTFTHSLVDVVETARAIKRVNPLIHVVLGGPHTYTFTDKSEHLLDLGCIDSIILGDGEETFKTMLEALDKKGGFEEITGIIYKDTRGNAIRKGGPVFIHNLDDLPFPLRDIYGVKYYYTPATEGSLMTTMITSRGCPNRCAFCNTYKDYRSRSVKNIVDEIEECAKLGIREIFFVDDTFNISFKRVIDISKEILKRNLKVKWGFKARCDQVSPEMLLLAKKAGCTKIHYGVETGSNEGLKGLNKSMTIEQIEQAFKLTKRAGIRTIAFFMLGCPCETKKEDVLTTINFAKRLDADYAVFAIFSPYPDTASYLEGVKLGIFKSDQWEMFIKNPGRNYVLPTYWEESFSKKELFGLLKKAHRKFYLRPKILFENLFGFHSIAELWRTIKGGLALLKLEFLRNSEGKI